MPLWCQLITRVAKPKSDEARCDKEEGLKKELKSMQEKHAWDVNDVYSLKDLLGIRPILRPCLAAYSVSSV